MPVIPLLLSLALLAVALTAVVEPPNNLLWMVSVPVKEFGWIFALLLCLPVVVTGIVSGGATGLAAGVLALAAALLSLVPLVRALPAAEGVAADLEAAFGPAPVIPGDRPAPFRWRDLFQGVSRPRVDPVTVTYAVHDGMPLPMDIYRPPGAGGGPAPAVLVLHGGAWRSGDRKQLPALNHYLAGRGYVVAAINYRLMPHCRFPEMLEDVGAAVRYLKEHAAAHVIDPGRLALLGRSAGGQLAVAYAYARPDPAIRAVVGFYAPLDLHWGYDQPCRVIDSHAVLSQLLGGDPRQVPEMYKAASAPYLAGPHSPPTLLIQGEADTMVGPPHGEHTVERLKAVGRPAYMLRVPLATHGSDFNFSGPFGQISTFAVERFLHTVMRETGGAH